MRIESEIYLEDLGEDWRMDMTIEDSQAKGPVTFEKVQTLSGGQSYSQN